MLRSSAIANSSNVMLNLFQHPSCPTDGALGGEMTPEPDSG
jgi:hypothetical protein